MDSRSAGWLVTISETLLDEARIGPWMSEMSTNRTTENPIIVDVRDVHKPNNGKSHNCGDIRKVVQSAKTHELEEAIDYGYFAVLW